MSIPLILLVLGVGAVASYIMSEKPIQAKRWVFSLLLGMAFFAFIELLRLISK